MTGRGLQMSADDSSIVLNLGHTTPPGDCRDAPIPLIAVHGWFLLQSIARAMLGHVRLMA